MKRYSGLFCRPLSKKKGRFYYPAANILQETLYIENKEIFGNFVISKRYEGENSRNTVYAWKIDYLAYFCNLLKKSMCNRSEEMNRNSTVLFSCLLLKELLLVAAK